MSFIATAGSGAALWLRRFAGRHPPTVGAGIATPQETYDMTTPAHERADPAAARAEGPPPSTPAKDELAEAREQLAGARRQRHAFLAGLAHDLRNPLAPLSNGLELMRLTDADPAGRLRTRAIMERQVGHLM